MLQDEPLLLDKFRSDTAGKEMSGQILTIISAIFGELLVNKLVPT